MLTRGIYWHFQSRIAVFKAEGLPSPLILKRGGFHVWKLENFPEDDPRHGWLWQLCWNDSATFFGSEKAVQQYVARTPEKTDEKDLVNTRRKDVSAIRS